MLVLFRGMRLWNNSLSLREINTKPYKKLQYIIIETRLWRYYAVGEKHLIQDHPGIKPGETQQEIIPECPARYTMDGLDQKCVLPLLDLFLL